MFLTITEAAREARMDKALVLFSQLASLTGNVVEEDHYVSALNELNQLSPFIKGKFQTRFVDLLGGTDIPSPLYDLLARKDVYRCHVHRGHRIPSQHLSMTTSGLRRADHIIYKGDLLEQQVRDAIAQAAQNTVDRLKIRGSYLSEKYSLSRYVAFDLPK